MRRAYLFIIILLSLAGGAITIYSTAAGPWGYSDPVEYISTASSILHGKGLGYYEGDAVFQTIALHPPFYSLVLSLVGLGGADLVAAARWLNLSAFAASIFTAGWVFWRFSRTPVLGVAASALMLFFPPMATAFSSAYSEPIFIFVFMAGGLCLLCYLRKENKILFILSALVLGMAPFTRYAGTAMLAAGILAVFFHASGKLLSRLKKSLLFGLIGSLPLALWLGFVYFSRDQTLGGRTVRMDWGSLANRFQDFRGILIDTIWKWIPFQTDPIALRYPWRLLLLVIACLLTVVLTFLAVRRLSKKGEGAGGAALFTYFGFSGAAYLAVVAGTYLFTNPTIDIDNRILLPLFVCVVMGILAAGALWEPAWLTGHRRWLQALPWAVVVLCCWWYFPQSLNIIKNLHQGSGLTAYKWKNAALIQAVRDLPVGQSVISNDWELLMLWTQRPIRQFWNTFSSLPTGAIESGQIRTAQSSFCEKGAAVAVFNDYSMQYASRYEVSPYQVPDLFTGLRVYGQYPEGTIYLCP